MFSNLKKKFILVYVLSIFLILVFFSFIIFYSSYSNMKKEILLQLELKELNRKDEPFKNDTIDDENSQDNSFYDNYRVFGEDVFVILNEEGSISQIISQEVFTSYEVDELEQTFAMDENNMLSIKDNNYAYRKYGNIIKMVNVTHFYNALRKLLFTLIFINILIIIVLLMVGYYLSNKAVDPIKEIFERQKVFVSDASHELKTPLTVISNCLELIKEGDDESDKWVEYCISETKRLKNLTSALLTLSKESAYFDISKVKKINLSEELDLLISAYEVTLFETDYILDTKIKDNIYAHILNDDFKQLFHILIDNAIKYNDDRKKIKITLRKNSKNIEFSISNSSDYIESLELDKIFDRFYRQDAVRSKKIEGFGLGLSLVKEICNKYKIRYEVKFEDSMMKFKFYII